MNFVLILVIAAAGYMASRRVLLHTVLCLLGVSALVTVYLTQLDVPTFAFIFFIVYAGAVIILFLFLVMLTGSSATDARVPAWRIILPTFIIVFSLFVFIMTSGCEWLTGSTSGRGPTSTFEPVPLSGPLFATSSMNDLAHLEVLFIRAASLLNTLVISLLAAMLAALVVGRTSLLLDRREGLRTSPARVPSGRISYQNSLVPGLAAHFSTSNDKATKKPEISKSQDPEEVIINAHLVPDWDRTTPPPPGTPGWAMEQARLQDLADEKAARQKHVAWLATMTLPKRLYVLTYTRNRDITKEVRSFRQRRAIQWQNSTLPTIFIGVGGMLVFVLSFFLPRFF